MINTSCQPEDIDENRFDVVMFPQTGAVVVCDLDIQIPNKKIYAYSVNRDILRKFDRESWNSAIKVKGEIFNQAVKQYLLWVANHGRHDDYYKEAQKDRLSLTGKAQPTKFLNYYDIEQYFLKYQILCLWHITHKNNVQSILNYGILNNYDAHKYAANFIDISDSSVQANRERVEPIFQRKIHSYASLYIKPRNPMMFVRQEIQNNLCLLEVSLKVLNNREFLITDGNAAALNTKFNASIDGLDLLDWNVLRARYWNDFPDGKRKRCAEILVYPRIMPEFISKIHCCSDQTLNFLANFTSKALLTKELFF